MAYMMCAIQCFFVVLIVKKSNKKKKCTSYKYLDNALIQLNKKKRKEVRNVARYVDVRMVEFFL